MGIVIYAAIESLGVICFAVGVMREKHFPPSAAYLVPAVALFLVGSIGAMGTTFARARGQMRLKAGQCPKCGKPLTAGRCAEHGRIG